MRPPASQHPTCSLKQCFELNQFAEGSSFPEFSVRTRLAWLLFKELYQQHEASICPVLPSGHRQLFGTARNCPTECSCGQNPLQLLAGRPSPGPGTAELRWGKGAEGAAGPAGLSSAAPGAGFGHCIGLTLHPSEGAACFPRPGSCPRAQPAEATPALRSRGRCWEEKGIFQGFCEVFSL